MSNCKKSIILSKQLDEMSDKFKVFKSYTFIYMLISITIIGLLFYLYNTNSCSSYVPLKSWNPGYSTAAMGYISDNVCICGGSGGQKENCQNRELKQQSYDKGNTEYTKLENQGYKSTNFNDYSSPRQN